MVVTFAGSLFLLALAVQTIPIGTAYAMFVGIDAVGAAALGIVLFGEPTHATRIFFLTLLIVSPVGLLLTATRREGLAFPKKSASYPA